MSTGHFRTVCEHGKQISTCRCPAQNKRTEVKRPCPFPIEHLGMVIVHPQAPAAALADPAPSVPSAAPALSEAERVLKVARWLEFRYAKPHVNHWEDLPTKMQRFWEYEATSLLIEVIE